MNSPSVKFIEPQKSDRFTILLNLNEMQFEKGFCRHYFYLSGCCLIRAGFMSVFLLIEVFFNSIKKHCLDLPEEIIYKSVKMAFFGLILGSFKLLISIFLDPAIYLLERYEKWRNPLGRTALIIIDAQKDFTVAGRQIVNGIEYSYTEGGLGVKDGYKVVPAINALLEKLSSQDLIVASLDWHPIGHKSFASSTKGIKAFDKVILSKNEQVVWPDHCIQGSAGAEFLPGLEVKKIQFIVKKGRELFVDSYSAFFDNGHKNKTILDEYLQGKNVKKLIIAGLATDYCVKYTALDALQLGYKVILIKDATYGVNDNDSKRALEIMEGSGVKIMSYQEIGKCNC